MTITLLVMGCTAEKPAEVLPPEKVQINVSISDGFSQVAPDTPLRVSASAGVLTSVQVVPVDKTDEKAHATVRGTLDATQRTWTAGRTLSPATAYELRATAVDSTGGKVTKSMDFITLSPTRTNRALLGPDDAQVVGVGMPITLRFSHKVTNKAAVEKSMKVVTTPATEGAWGWVLDPVTHQERLDWRPSTFWRPGTKVVVTAALSGVDTGEKRYLPRDISTEFSVGAARVTRVNLDSHRMTVTEDGRTVRTIPISGGGPDTPTLLGTMIVLDKAADIRMNSETVGLGNAYDKNVKWAVHLTSSGTYAHAAPWNTSLMGIRNASHGCVGMNTEDARWFYERSRPGDVVISSGSRGRAVDVGNGFGHWNTSFDQWKKRSAL
ncbi:Ig-like domain-containing protein [Streptomyces sp. NPDC087908]|uniref:L,D-transpeptidase n=1 Tax=Streptomyces sp. NPDC087908 TaxID=3365820 RepID=UPI00382ABEB9